jgi:hypothetical protein
MLPHKTMDHPTLDVMVHYLVAYILSWLLSSNGLQHLVNHKSPNYISCDIFNKLRNLLIPLILTFLSYSKHPIQKECKNT